MTWTTTLNGSSMHKNRAWVPPRRSFKLLKPKWGVGPGPRKMEKMGPGKMGPGGPGLGTRLAKNGTRWRPRCGTRRTRMRPGRKKLDAVTTQMGLVWENGTRWDPGDNPDGTCVGRMGPGDDLDLVHFWICACHSCAGVFSVSFPLYRMVRWGKNGLR